MRFRIDAKREWKEFKLDISVDIEARALSISGPSGSGKTTLVESMVGFRNAIDTLILDGETIISNAKGPSISHRRIGFVPQDTLLFQDRSVDKNLRAARNVDEQRLTKLVETFELEALLNRLPQTLSGGEKKRVAIARALCATPRLLILDEPLAGLDAVRQTRVFGAIESARDEFNTPVVWVSHDSGASKRLCDAEITLCAGNAHVATS